MHIVQKCHMCSAETVQKWTHEIQWEATLSPNLKFVQFNLCHYFKEGDDNFLVNMSSQSGAKNNNFNQSNWLHTFTKKLLSRSLKLRHKLKMKNIRFGDGVIISKLLPKNFGIIFFFHSFFFTIILNFNFLIFNFC